MRADGQVDLMANQIPQDRVNGTQLVELIEDQTNDGLHLFIRIQGDLAGGQTHVANRRVIEQFTAFGLVQSALVHPLAQDMQFGLTQGPLKPKQ